MKVQYIVTIEGGWFHNGKQVNAAIVEKQLRAAVKDEFEFLADRVTVKKYKSEQPNKDAP